METQYEDRGSVLLHNFVKLLPDYTASNIPELSLIKELINE
jgi:hypothetical protein